MEFDRRRLIMFAVGAGASRVLAAAEFWNARASSTWTDEEVGALISKSPWAKAAIPTMKAAKGEDPVSDPAARGGRGFRLTPITVTVRWESAQPILDALKSPLAADFEGHYVVSVTNLPMENARRTGRGADTTPDDALERLQAGAILQVKGKEPTEAGIVRRTRIGSILFGFSKDYLRVAPGDREIVFKLDTGQLTLQAKFDAKEMNYRGELAL